MATRRFKIPMVEDAPQRQPSPLETGEAPSSDYDWDAWGDLLIACLIVPKTLPDLVDLWKANDAMIGYCKTIRPKVFEKVRNSFTQRKLTLQKDG